MNVNLQSMNRMAAPGRMANGGLKSTQQKMERQQKCTDQIQFLEKQKEHLKTMQCDSLEDITRKLEMFHSYEDQIAEAKKEYNNSQMMHALDEARERGEKIAEAAEKTKAKTAEERRKDMQEEALGTEEDKGMLTEIMEEVSEMLEETTEEAAEEVLEEITEDTAEETLEEVPQEYAEQGRQEVPLTQTEIKLQEASRTPAEMKAEKDLREKEVLKYYQHFDQSV